MPSPDDPLDEVDEAALRIAMRWQQIVVGEDCAAVIGACCWMLANLLRQTAIEGEVSVSESLECVTAQVWQCVGSLELFHQGAAAEDVH